MQVLHSTVGRSIIYLYKSLQSSYKRKKITIQHSENCEPIEIFVQFLKNILYTCAVSLKKERKENSRVTKTST